MIENKSIKNAYALSEHQVNSILDLKLQKLTSMGINEIESEIKKLSELITKFEKILKSKKELYNLIIDELQLIKDKFSVPRRSKIIDAVLNYNIEETIQKESVVITITNKGYIKRGSLGSIKAQKRGGKGRAGIKTREEDFVAQIFTANSHTPVLFFSTEGLVYKLKAWKIPQGTSTSKGKTLFNILPLKNHQSISSIMPLPENEEEWKKYFIIFVTAKGKVRKNTLEDFKNINNSGKIAMKLDEGDRIVGVKICKDNQDVMLSTKLGKCIRFMSKKLRVFKGRSSKGIRGMNLSEGDSVISLSIINSMKSNGDSSKKSKNEGSDFVLSITENGYGKRTSLNDFRVTNRGGKGIIGIVNSKRNGNVASASPINSEDEVIISTDKGRVIRCAVKEIRAANRNTQGVRIFKLTGDEKVVSAVVVEDNIIE